MKTEVHFAKNVYTIWKKARLKVVFTNNIYAKSLY